MDADGMQVQKSKGRSSRAPQSDQPKLAPAKEKTKATGGGFAALAGFDDDDSAAILEKKLRKAKKKAEKKAAADALVAETAKASFEELKASLASGGGNCESNGPRTHSAQSMPTRAAHMPARQLPRA